MNSTTDPPEPTDEVPQLRPRDPHTHKGQVGRIAIVAGSRGMTGAAVLCGRGALRGGAGLVRLHCPAGVQAIIAAGEVCLMTVGLPEPAGETPDEQRRAAETAGALVDAAWADVLAVGPGLGTTAYAQTLVLRLLGLDLPLVLDADGLNVLAAAEADQDKPASLLAQRSAETIITPHPGELARLRKAAGLAAGGGTDDDARLRIAHEYARFANATVVLKGHRTVVCTPDRAYINTTGNPGMATGGMGDVLTGLIAALLGQGLDAFDAARLGVYVHGLAADRAAERIGAVGYLARDVADLLPEALAASPLRSIGFHNRQA